MLSARRVSPPILVAAVLLLAFLPVSAADAATNFYASPGGSGNGCTQVTPCKLETAVGAAGAGDTVFAAPGTYKDNGTLSVPHEVTLSGEAGKAKPLIKNVGGGTYVIESLGAPTLRYLRVEAAGYGILLADGRLEQVESIAGQYPCSIARGKVWNSLCVGTDPTGVGLSIGPFTVGSSTAELLGDTLVGGGVGILGSNGFQTTVIEAANTIASGGTNDLEGFPSQAGSKVEFKMSHSNFSTVGQIGGGTMTATLPTEEGNQSAASIFTDAAAGDYTEQFSSPTRQAGTLSKIPTGFSEFDLAGNPRRTACHGITYVDIGAYELPCPPPVTIYAAPNGSAGNAPCTTQASPCDLETAAGEVETAGDTVILATGTYHLVHVLSIAEPVNFEGTPGQPAPLIEVGTGGLQIYQGLTVRDIRVHAEAGAGSALLIGGGDSRIERVESTGAAEIACDVTGGTMRDSLCATTRIEGSLGFRGFTDSKLVNDTIVGGEAGMEFQANGGASVDVEAINTIVSGGSFDIGAFPRDGASSVDVVLSHSNFSTVRDELEEEGGGGIGFKGTVTSPTANGNQSAEPVFADAAGGNYTEQESSPTKSAGDLSAVEPGEVDLAGNARTITCGGTTSVDIGAYQLGCPSPSSGGGSSGGGGSNTQPPTVAPKLTKLALKPSKFEKSTKITFTLSAIAKVKLEVLQKKKQKNGKTKTVKLGNLSQVSGKSGSNKVKFNGKVKGKRLAPGKYTLRATATAQGLSSKAQTKQFEVIA